MGHYCAKSLVYHYNRLPPFSQQKFLIGKRAAIIGIGNVMVDVARYLIKEREVEEVIAVARRGPGEAKFTTEELESVAGNLDLAALDAEFSRVSPIISSVGQDGEKIKQKFLEARPAANEPASKARFRFEFLSSPARVLGDWLNGVSGLEVEDNILVEAGDQLKARGTGKTRKIELDTVIFAIGDAVDVNFCLSVCGNSYMSAAEPSFPVDGVSFEACNPETKQAIEGIFLVGWARRPSTGLVGNARRDGEMAAKSILQYLPMKQPVPDSESLLSRFVARLKETQVRVVDQAHLAKLEEAERATAASMKVEDFKFLSNEEMFAAMELEK